MKSLKRWETEEVELTFGIKKAARMAAMDEWMAADEPADKLETTLLKRYWERLNEQANYWSEDEIKYLFLSQIIALVDFYKKDAYSTFMERIIEAKAKDIHQTELPLKIQVELLVAQGKQRPRQPYFFLQNYKPLFKNTPNDPVGQLLIAMLASQNLNSRQRPLYGVYVVETFWHFIILDGNEYSESAGLIATKETALFKIFSMLKRCKSYIEAEFAQP